MRRWLKVDIATRGVLQHGTTQDALFDPATNPDLTVEPGVELIALPTTILEHKTIVGEDSEGDPVYETKIQYVPDEIDVLGDVHKYLEDGTVEEMLQLKDVITFSASVVDADVGVLTLNNVPMGTKIRISGLKGFSLFEVMDDPTGIVEYQSNREGFHYFSFEHPGYKDYLDHKVIFN